MKNHEIVALKNIVIKGSSSTIAELEDDITMYGGLKTAISEGEKRHKELETENLALEKKNELWKRENEALRMAGEEVREAFKKDTEEMAGVARTAKEALESTSAGFVQAVQQVQRDTAEKVMMVGTNLEGLSDAVLREAEKIKKNQSLLHYEPLARAELGEIVSSRAIVVALVLAIRAGESQLSGPWLSEAKRYLNAASNKMDEALKYGGLT